MPRILELNSEEPPAIDVQSVKRKSVGGAISYFGRSIFLNALGLVSALVLSGYLSPAEFGIFGYVTQFVGLLSFLSDIGLAASLIQSKHEPTSEELTTTFTVQFLLSLIIFACFVALGFSPLIASKGTAATWVAMALGISFPLATLKVIPSVLLERNLDFHNLVIPQIIEQLIYNTLLIVLVWQGWGIEAFVWAVLLRSIGGVVCMWLIKPWMPRLQLRMSVLRQLAHFGLKFQLNDILARVKDQLFYIVLGLYYPATTFGYISWAKNWSMYPYNLTVQNVMAVTFPTFSRLQHHPSLLAKAINKAIFFIACFIFPLLVGMSVLMFPLVAVVPRFGKWTPALATFVWFTLSIGWGAISTPLTNTLNAIGQINTTLKLMIMWTVLTWVVTPICIWIWGYEGVAIAAFLIACTSVVPIWQIQKLIPEVHVVEQVWRPLVAAGGMAALGLFLMPWAKQGFLPIIGTGAAMSLVYGLLLLTFGWRKLQTEVRSLWS